jgi:hypothetical protein
MDRISRRTLVRAGLGAGALLLLGGCGGGAARRPGIRVAPRNGTPEDWDFVSHKPAWLDGSRAPSGTPAPVGGVMPRSAWTRAQPRLWAAKPMERVEYITVHHDGMSPFSSTSPDAAAQRLEAIRNAHVSGQGWADIGYHYVVDPSGRIWHARPEHLQGAHVKDHNERNLGVMVLGNYEQQAPTYASAKALDDFVAALMRRYRVPVSRVYTHREMRPTACPGRTLQQLMESTRSRGGALARA